MALLPHDIIGLSLDQRNVAKLDHIKVFGYMNKNVSSIALLYDKSKVIQRDEELTIVTHPAVERIGGTCYLGEIMAHKSYGGRKPIAPRSWP